MMGTSIPTVDYVGDDLERVLRGNARQMEVVRQMIRSVARYRGVPVLVLGETGTGKELVARALHDTSFGPDAPFIAINCAAIPSDLLESELFGHEAGAYTGARTAKPGLFEAARGGTVFLDEIGEMDSALQPKLLRVLEAQEFRRVGSAKTQRLQARIVSATNRNPWDCRDAVFRSDLAYRLAGFTIRMPPLRERASDIELLANHFVDAFRRRYPTPGLRISDEALAQLRSHAWPGNVRELRAVIEHAAIVVQGALIDAKDVRAAMSAHQPAPTSDPPMVVECPAPRGLRCVERDVILRAVANADGNLSRAARELEIPRSTLRSKLKRFAKTATCA